MIKVIEGFPNLLGVKIVPCWEKSSAFNNGVLKNKQVKIRLQKHDQVSYLYNFLILKLPQKHTDR